MYSYFGAVENISSEDSEFPVINNIVGGVANIDNVWGMDAKPMRNLYFVLKRVYKKLTDSYEEFAFHPYAGWDYPSIMDLQYEDLNGDLQNGVVIHVGRVLDVRYKASDKNIVLQAAGLKGTVSSSFEAAGSITKIKVILNNQLSEQRINML